jgi:hypothetical protein
MIRGPGREGSRAFGALGLPYFDRRKKRLSIQIESGAAM